MRLAEDAQLPKGDFLEDSFAECLDCRVVVLPLVESPCIREPEASAGLWTVEALALAVFNIAQ